MPAPKNPQGPQPSGDTATVKPDMGKYYVDAVGVPYSQDGVEGAIVVGTHGQVIEITDDEARRLLGLGVIRAATEGEVVADRERRAKLAEIDAQNTAGPSSNPFGGRVMAGVSLEAHAAEQIELARKAGRL